MYKKKADQLDKILDLLLVKTEISQKEIKNLTKLPYTQVVRGLDTLERNGLVTLYTRSARESNRKGPASNIWSLTINGLFERLSKADCLKNRDFDSTVAASFFDNIAYKKSTCREYYI